jgi:hypothetical protein
VLVSICFYAKAQVTSTQRIDAESIESIKLQLEQVAFINIKTSDTQKIEIKTESSGEYSQDIGLNKQIKQNELSIESFFDKKLKGGFDKLSAVKVFSIGLRLVIPADIKVDIRTDITNIKIRGDYKAVHIENKFGNCRLNEFQGDAQINTFSGNVYIETANAQIKASTENGEKEIESITGNKYFIDVKTVDGNIQVESMF